MCVIHEFHIVYVWNSYKPPHHSSHSPAAIPAIPVYTESQYTHNSKHTRISFSLSACIADFELTFLLELFRIKFSFGFPKF